VLGRARATGLLPAFPFGSDMTAEEQRLAVGLRTLAAASSVERAKFFLKGLRSGVPSQAVQADIARMGLAHPATFREFLYRTLLRGVLGNHRPEIA